ncbi:MAG: Ig-like domain-containing protein, partial [bacterium]
AGTIAVGLTTSFTEKAWYDGDCRRPGEIVDSDIIFNPAMTYRTDTQGPPDGIDIQSVTAHELGHFFGIAHSALSSATMYFVLQDGTEARSLEVDDQIQMIKAYGAPATMAAASRLSGSIVDGYSGEPVSGAAVFAIDEASGDTLGCEYTLQDGTYEFIGLPDGDYYIGAHPLDGSSAVNYVRPAYINDYLAGLPVTQFVPEAWDSLESATDDADDRDPIAVLAGTTAVANIIGNIDAAGPEVVSTVPDSSATDVPIDAAVLISFSEGLNTETLQGNFSLTDTTTQAFISGNAAFLKDDSLIAFMPMGELGFSSTYRLRIETGLEDRFGNHLAEDFVMLFTTEPEPDVVLTSLTPSKGVVGMTLAINGNGFDPLAANDSVSFNGVEAEVTEASPTQLVVVVPQGATSGAVSVYNAAQGKESNSLQFTVLSPDEVPKGFESGVCALGATPRAVTLTPDGKYAFVATDAGAVAVVAAPDSSGYMTATAVPIAGGLVGIDAGPAGDRVYAVSSATQEFYRLNSTWGAVSVLSEKPVGAVPRGILVHPNGRRAFVPTDDGEIQVWDIDEQSPSLDTQIGVIDQVDPDVLGDLAIDPAGQVLLAPTGAGKLLVIDPDSNLVAGTVDVGLYLEDVAVDPATGYAYVCDENGVLGVASPGQGSVLWRAKLGGSLYGISLTPAGTFALVVNRELDLISAVDLRGNSSSFLSVVATISLPENPVDIDLSPDGDYAFTISEAEKKLVATAIGVGPSLTSVSRRTGPVGTSLVLAGSGFMQAVGAMVLFGGVGGLWAQPGWVTDSSLGAVVPVGTTSGTISVGIGDASPELESNSMYFEILGATEDDMLRPAAALPGSPGADGGSVVEASPADDYLALADKSGHLHALLVDEASALYCKFIGSLDLGSNASDIAFPPDGKRAFVALPDSNAVLVVGADRLKADFLAAVDTIDFSGIVGSELARLAASPDGSLLLVSDPGAALVHCVDVAAGSPTEYEIIQSVDVSGTLGASRVYEMAFHPGGWYAYLGFDDTDCPKVCALDTEAASATYLELIAGA